MANYFLIGGDGKEYGPVTSEDLRQWIAQKRANHQSKVRLEGTTEWLAIGEIPEFADVPPSAPPPLAARPVPAAGKPPKSSSMAILSLVLGVFGLFTCGATSVFGLVLGIIAMVKIGNSRGELRGKGVALAGVITSALLLIIGPAIGAAMMLPALAAAKQKASQINCVNNEKQLALAVRIYSGDHTNHLPSAAAWCDDIRDIAGYDKVFQCPLAKEPDRCHYAFNAKLSGLAEDDINPQTVMIFESDSGWNAHGGPELLAAPRHRKNTVVALADGSVQVVSEAQIGNLRWDP